MEYSTLGSSGVKISRLCLGTWRFGKETNGTIETDREQAHSLLDAAWEYGVNFIDTANSYGSGKSEEFIGDWLAEHDREDFVIASKVYWATRGISNHRLGKALSPTVRSKGLSRKTIRAEIEGSLERLGTDYLDIYYIHCWDEETPIEETLSTLNNLVQEGKVHYVGASNTAGWQLMKALWKSDINGLESFGIVQPKFNAVYQEEVAELLDACADQDVAVCPYSPLEGGFLTGKYTKDGELPSDSRGDLQAWKNRFSAEQWDTLERVCRVSEELDSTPAQVALRWLMQQKRVSTIPVIGARTTDQLKENIGSVEISLSDKQYQRINQTSEANAEPSG